MSTTTLELQTPVTAAGVERRFYLLDFERNGPNDSDFIVVYWDDATGSIEQAEYGSTRYAGNPGGEALFKSLRRDITEEVRERIRDYIRKTAIGALTRLAKREIEQPGPSELVHGAEVKLTVGSSPRSKDKWEAGAVGEVFWAGQHGTFFRNGYKQRSRENGRIGVRLADGRSIFCPMKSAVLNRKIDTAEIERRADAAARALDVESCIAGFTWASATNPLLRRSADWAYRA